MSTSTVTSKGQITIPKAIREIMRLRPGDEVAFVRHHDGRVEMTARNLPVQALAGMLADVVPRRGRPVTVEAMNAAIAREVAALDRATRGVPVGVARAGPPKRRRTAA